MKLKTSQGVALVITVIMLSVITFMAITFLALARREKGVVATTKDMTQAKFGMDGGTERAKAELLANILATTNINSFNLLVSTNYIRWEGFDPSAGDGANWQQLSPASVNGFTNVNFDYIDDGTLLTPLTPAQRLQNLTNLLFSPRVPVWGTNRNLANSEDFRFYLDLNRNGRYDRSGYWLVTNVDTSGKPITTTNFANVVGDPEWIGVLERPGFPHSATNRFISRYCYIIVPAGKTLDLNYIHNNAKLGTVQGFLRNQGVGTWEINYASFLADLNTNFWNFGAPYNYNYNLGFQSLGTAFEDAYAMWKWRQGAAGQASFNALYGGAASTKVLNDFVDNYSAGPVLLNMRGYTTDPDAPVRTANPWSGADVENHYFTTQEAFDPVKTTIGGTLGFKFPDRVYFAGTNLSTYDNYTFYRMLSQLGTDSTSEEADKLNLNYVNVQVGNHAYGATNFVRWDDPNVASYAGVPVAQVGVVMFTNIANRLLSRYTQDWRDNDLDYYKNFFGTNQPFNSTSIPVWFSNRMVYTPSVHRLLQLAANIVDTAVVDRGGIPTNLPSVFRPRFQKVGNDIYITSFTEAGADVAARVKKPLALDNPVEFALIDQDSNIYGVPWIIGAKKGLPNFNEFAMETVFEITRKIQVSRSSAGVMSTNLMYVVGVSNAMATEAWNSYATNYARGVGIFVTNEIAMALTNDAGTRVPLNLTGPASIGNAMSITATKWPGYQKGLTNSFAIPMSVNLVVQRPATYLFASAKFATGVNEAFENFPGFPQPNWGLQITNRLRFFMVDQGSGRVIDYVQLDSLNTTRNLSEEVREKSTGRAGGDITVFNRMWITNRLGNINSFLVPTVGISNQIWVSANNVTLTTADWKSIPGTYGDYKTGEIATFAKFLTNGIVGTQQAPFTPTKRMAQHITWQANDPLVHYSSGDLVQVLHSNDVTKLDVNVPPQLLKNIGQVNSRFSPWGGNKEKGSEETMDDDSFYNVALKDPLVESSDDWDFHTNAFPNVGWLGRVHRGTPWQTVYLKSSDLGLTAFPTPLTSAFTWVTNGNYSTAAKKWSQWSGNPNQYDAFYTRPAADRVLFDVFTTAVNDNATRGQLPINQDGLAAWSAVLGGVVAITNAASDVSLVTSTPVFNPEVIQPAGYYDPSVASIPLPALVRIVNGINNTRTNAGLFPSRSFKHLGDILATPELSTNSPFLNTASLTQKQKGISDSAYEWIPQQIMSLLRVGEPRFVVYSYGQALHPAENSVVTTSGAYFGLCTNYQITAEIASRAVVRMEGSSNPADGNNPNPKLHYPPRLVVESYNVLGPE